MRNINADTITQAVIARHAQAGDARLRDLMTSLVQHLHAFAREVRLTEAEWNAGLHFLEQAGRISSAERQELRLLSDTLGLSALVTALNQRKPDGCTEATAPAAAATEGAETCFVRGRVRAPSGAPVPGAQVRVGDGPPVATDAEGRFVRRTTLAEPAAIPHDGPVGRLLESLGRHPWRPAHLRFAISAPGYEPLATQVFREGAAYLDSDAGFGVRPSLVADWQRHPAGPAPDGGHCAAPFYTLDFDFVLAPLRLAA